MQTIKYFYLLLDSYSVDIKMTQYYSMASSRKKPLPVTTNTILIMLIHLRKLSSILKFITLCLFRD